MGTAIVLAVLIMAVVMIIRSMLKDRRKGKSISCGCNCSSFHGACHQNLKKEIERLRNAE